jgi:hypothetical protein
LLVRVDRTERERITASGMIQKSWRNSISLPWPEKIAYESINLTSQQWKVIEGSRGEIGQRIGN